MSDAGALSVELLCGEDAFALLEQDWRALESLDPACTPFNTFDWNALWWRHYGGSSTALLMRVSCAGQVVGVAPFHLRTEREQRLFQPTVLRFVGSGGDTSPDYLGVLARPEHRAGVINAVLDALWARDDWQSLRLNDIALDSELDLALRARLGEWPGYSAPVERTLVLTAALPGSWAEFVSTLSRKRRKQINHRRNRLEEAGSAVLSRAQSPAERAVAVDTLIELHRGRWLSKGEAGGFGTDAYEGFHRDVMETFAQRDELWLVTLTLDEAIIGVLYAFAWRGELMLFQSGLSPEHERLSPGHVLFGWVIEQAIQAGFTRLNMLKGDYHYKTAWAREQTWTVNHAHMRPGASSVIAAWRQRLRGCACEDDSSAAA